jgi:hypothetical protein
MSNPTNWAAFGASIQEEAKIDADRVVKEQEAARQAAIQQLEGRRMQQHRAQVALEKLKQHCMAIVSSFNTRITDDTLLLRVEDSGIDKFLITKSRGIPLLALRAYEGDIRIDLQDSSRPSLCATDQYGVDAEGRFTMRDGTAIEIEQIIEPAIKLLIHAKYRG